MHRAQASIGGVAEAQEGVRTRAGGRGNDAAWRGKRAGTLGHRRERVTIDAGVQPDRAAASEVVRRAGDDADRDLGSPATGESDRRSRRGRNRDEVERRVAAGDADVLVERAIVPFLHGAVVEAADRSAESGQGRRIDIVSAQPDVLARRIGTLPLTGVEQWSHVTSIGFAQRVGGGQVLHLTNMPLGHISA